MVISKLRGMEQDIPGKLPEHSPTPRTAIHPSLDEIQIRAYRVHYRHGGIFGGYTLDEWLEAEHELDEESKQNRKRTENVH
jgi:hypothetical protein